MACRGRDARDVGEWGQETIRETSKGGYVEALMDASMERMQRKQEWERSEKLEMQVDEEKEEKREESDRGIGEDWAGRACRSSSKVKQPEKEEEEEEEEREWTIGRMLRERCAVDPGLCKSWLLSIVVHLSRCTFF